MAKTKKKQALICCGVILAVILLIATILIALSLTVFRPRSPHVTATIVNTRVSGFALLPAPVLNLTFDVAVSAYNPNRAAFEYGEVVTAVRYHGDGVGEAVVPAGRIGARASAEVRTAVEVDAVGVVTSPYFPAEGIAGALPFETATTVAGKAVVLRVFRVPARSVVTCGVTVFPLRSESTPPQCTSTVHVG
uniref:Late embryogenesis abundant protein LEA-2 subgroup domain-containing protein n=1 Tax=Leersia perrieri TaxID=77586 RepID=A0A0D9WZM1_9ORYZ